MSSPWKQIKFLPVAEPRDVLELREGEPVEVIDPLGRAWRTGYIRGRRLRQQVSTLYTGRAS